MTDDLAQLRRPQHVQRRRAQLALRERVEVGHAPARRRGLGAAVVLDRLEPEVGQILLVALRHLHANLALDRLLDAALRDQFGQAVLDLGQRLAVLAGRGKPVAGRVLEDEPLQGKDAVRQRRRPHELQGLELARTQHHLVGAERVREQLVQRFDIAPRCIVATKAATKPCNVGAVNVSHG